MDFLIREFDKSKDSDNFLRLSFETLVSIKGTPPGTSHQEFFEWAKVWVQDYIEELELNKIFVAEDNLGNYIGHIWLSLQDEMKPWEVEKYFWIQNITVEKEFRRQGIGTALMSHAENYIKTLKGNNLGLHVNSESQDALRLYKTLGYSVYMMQFFKKLRPSHEVNVSNAEYKIEEMIFDQGLISLKDLIFKSFELKLRNATPEDVIRKKFSVYLDTLIKNQDKNHIFSICNKIGDAFGFLILEMSELKYEKSVWIKDIGFLDDLEIRQIFSDAYAFIKNWAQNHEIALVEIVLPKNQKSLIDSYNEYGFEIFGYFMQKKLI
jgi:ribosomal protein S18 acetylase RimI-like enzyme